MPLLQRWATNLNTCTTWVGGGWHNTDRSLLPHPYARVFRSNFPATMFHTVLMYLRKEIVHVWLVLQVCFKRKQQFFFRTRIAHVTSRTRIIMHKHIMQHNKGLRQQLCIALHLNQFCTCTRIMLLVQVRTTVRARCSRLILRNQCTQFLLHRHLPRCILHLHIMPTVCVARTCHRWCHSCSLRLHMHFVRVLCRSSMLYAHRHRDAWWQRQVCDGLHHRNALAQRETIDRFAQNKSWPPHATAKTSGPHTM